MIKSSRRALRAFTLAACVWPTFSIGAQAPALELEDASVRQPFTLYTLWENDGALIRPGGPDRHYSNGGLISFAHQPRWADDIADALNLRYDATAAGYLFGHQIFTPENLNLAIPDPTDRPYAGYVFGGVYWQRERNDSLDHLQLDLGLVGPSAKGKQLQSSVHNTFAGDDPQGWDSQIEDTFTYQFTYRKKWRIDLNEPGDGPREGLAALDWQLLPQVGFGLGNVYRQAEAGVTLRFGQQMSDDFGPARIADLASATGLSRALAASRAPGASKWSWSLFGRAAARFVEHNLFLDGPDSGGGPAVESEPIVGELSAGGTLRYRFDGHWALHFEYSQTLLTDEFKGQDTLDGYATLLVALRATW